MLIEEPPEEVAKAQERLLLKFWYVSPNVRTVLTQPDTLREMAEGKYPFFCMYNGYCRMFGNKELLEKHWNKKPDHNISIKDLEEKAEAVKKEQER